MLSFTHLVEFASKAFGAEGSCREALVSLSPLDLFQVGPCLILCRSCSAAVSSRTSVSSGHLLGWSVTTPAPSQPAAPCQLPHPLLVLQLNAGLC